MNLETQIYMRFHIIDDRLKILLHNLKILNEYQNKHYLLQSDLNVNRNYYDPIQQNQYENEKLDIQIQISTLTQRCIEDMENLIYETIQVVDSYKTIKENHEITILFNDKFVPFIQGVSNLESLFLSNLPQIEELMSKTILFANILQDVLHFDIQIEKVFNQ
jgi:hypothetical protein